MARGEVWVSWLISFDGSDTATTTTTPDHAKQRVTPPRLIYPCQSQDWMKKEGKPPPSYVLHHYHHHHHVAKTTTVGPNLLDAVHQRPPHTHRRLNGWVIREDPYIRINGKRAVKELWAYWMQCMYISKSSRELLSIDESFLQRSGKDNAAGKTDFHQCMPRRIKVKR